MRNFKDNLNNKTLRETGVLPDYPAKHRELVLCLPRKVVDSVFAPVDALVNLTDFLDTMAQYLAWIPRWYANHTEDWVQLIGYVVNHYEHPDTRESHYLTYQRSVTATEDTRQSGRLSIGFGGHINPSDSLLDGAIVDINTHYGFLKTLENSVKREVSEELNGVDTQTIDLTKLGIVSYLRSIKDAISRVHLGIEINLCHKYENTHSISIRETDKLNTIGWLTRREIVKTVKTQNLVIEPWSMACLPQA